MKKEVAERIRSIFTAPGNEEALRLLHLFCKDYREKAPDLAEWAETALPEDLVVMQMPLGHPKKIPTVDMLERLNKEINRRTRVATLFPNPASCLRLVLYGFGRLCYREDNICQLVELVPMYHLFLLKMIQLGVTNFAPTDTDLLLIGQYLGFLYIVS